MTKQTIKQFLKPDWRKIVLFLMLFMFCPIIFPWLSTSHCVRTEVYIEGFNYQCEPQWTISYGWVFSAIINEAERIPSWTIAPFEVKGLPPAWYPFYYIYHLFFSYFLSCLIVFAYNKFRRGC